VTNGLEQPVLGGRFFITATLGAGDIARAYDVRDAGNSHFLLETVDPRVANDPRAWATCQEQAHAADALQAGLFARLLEAGVDSALGPCLLRESVPGMSLASLLAQERRLTAAQTLKLLTRLGAGLEEAHRVGVVHRGLGPWCIMVGAISSLESVRVGELGLAILRATVPAPWPGPLGWMSAAQAEGAPVSPAMDIHALAMIAFFALTGQPLLRTVASGSSDPALVWAEMMNPPLASQRAAELGVTLPAVIDSVMSRAVAKQPAAPFPSAVTFVQALDDALRPAQAAFAKTLLIGQPAFPAAPADLDALEDGWPSNVPPEVTAEQAPAEPASLAGVEIAAPANPPHATVSGLGPAEPEAPISPPAAAPSQAAVPVAPGSGYATPSQSPAQYAAAEYPSSMPAPAKPSRIGLWIAIGAVLFVGMLGVGGVGGYLLLRPGKPASSAASVAIPSASAAEAVALPPPASASAVPEAPPASASAAPEAPPAASASTGVVFSCTPACRDLDSITCDEKPRKLDDQGRLELEPGAHRCVLAKAGYQPAKLRLELKAGQTEERRVELVREKATGGTNAPKRPCGTFINPCP
jgi:eukaryotic-like serine/threonine-protein kinase